MDSTNNLRPPKYKNHSSIPDDELEQHLYSVAQNFLFRCGICDYAFEKYMSESQKCLTKLNQNVLENIFEKAKLWYINDILSNPNYKKPAIYDKQNQNQKWSEPIPLNEIRPPSFPVKCFPDTLCSFIIAVSEFSETSAEMCGVLLLGALGGVFQRKYEVVSTAGNAETLSIFAVAIAEPAERKSGVIRKVIEPFSQFEKEYNFNHKTEISKSIADKKILAKKLATAEKDGNDDELIDAQTAFDNFEEVFPLSLLSDDTTPEAIVVKMKNQGERTIVTASEGGFFKRIKGRYTPNGDDKEIYLKAHSGDRHSVDRIGRPSNVLENPAISIIMTAQKCVIEDFINTTEMNDTGMTARFLYAFCEEKAGNGRSPTRQNSLEYFEYIFSLYSEVIKFALKNTVDNKEILKIELSPEAFNFACNYFYACEKRIKEGSPNAKNWNGKAFGLAIRIAGLFHCFECFEKNIEPSSVKISELNMINSAYIVDCFAVHTEKIFSPSDKQNQDAIYLLGRIRQEMKNRKSNAPFSKTEIIRLTHGRFKNAEALIPALSVLEDYGYITTNFLQTGGRPTERIEINPNFMSCA
ncbi:hypothetical protein FACS1894132_13710 [Clostridia bacterium]|nr:hypothetical protein FACS1894132_13710 [Clostridia bacterium]